MAAFVLKRLPKLSVKRNWVPLKFFLQEQPVVISNARNNHMFRHLANAEEHGTEYSYEISKDPKEWESVERLMPLETVPFPKTKSTYPSGWRPPKDEALQLPYFVERSKNHMLSVYLKLFNKGQTKLTKVVKIHGDLWKLHEELKAHIEKVKGKKIASFVHEGNSAVHFKGDHVYIVEQWMLKKGF